jgi:hypothetical protein
MRGHLRWLILTALWALAGLAAVVPAMMTPMMFDAPGSERNPVAIGLAISVAVFPLICLSSAVLPWLFRRRRFAAMFFLLPVANLALIAAIVFTLDYFCGGQFSCQLGAG